MGADRKLRLSLLGEMLEQASALDSGSDPKATLERAFARGVIFLEAAGGKSGNSERPATAQCRAVAGRARFDFLRHRALALTEDYRELDRSVDDLATESQELHQKLWAWREREEPLKVRLGRRRAVTPRPEPAPTIGSGGPGKARRPSGERLLAGLERCEVELELPAELLARAETLGRSQGWDEEWGEDALLIVLAHGLAARELEESPPGARPNWAEQQVADPVAFAALHYRIFELSENNRILRIRETAFKVDNRGMRLRLGQLEQEVAELEEELSRSGGQWRASEERPRRGLLGRLLRRPRR
jgi:hypothetical protein